MHYELDYKGYKHYILEALNSGFKSLVPVWYELSVYHLNCCLPENLVDTNLFVHQVSVPQVATCKVDFYNEGKLQGHSINIKSGKISQSLPRKYMA